MARSRQQCRVAKRRAHRSRNRRTSSNGLQPYHGDNLLALLAKIANTGKHRRLLTVQDRTGFDIYFAKITENDECRGCFVYPMEKGMAIFARPKGDGTVLLMNEYSAMPLLNAMIEHTTGILRAFYCFLER